MTAIGRFNDVSGNERLALLRLPGNSTEPLRVCPLASVLGVEEERRLLLGNAIFATPLSTIHEWPKPGEADWEEAPSRFLPPVTACEKILCIGLNYRDHAIETGATIPTEPVVFSKFRSALIGSGDGIVLPSISDQVDYEAELVVVIGRTARHVSIADAMEHVFGYTIGHDVSARDWQKGRPGGQWLLGKTFDTFAPIGPGVVTADQIDDPGHLRVRLRINGETMQDGTTSEFIFDVPYLISHLSKFMTLRPGDLIFTGTPPGVGATRTPPRFLKPGDRCEVEIEGLGHLENFCVADSH